MFETKNRNVSKAIGVKYLFSLFITIPYPRDINSAINLDKVFRNAEKSILNTVNAIIRFPF